MILYDFKSLNIGTYLDGLNIARNFLAQAFNVCDFNSNLFLISFKFSFTFLVIWKCFAGRGAKTLTFR